MAESDWTSTFARRTRGLGKGDSWRLEFDNSLVPGSPERGWQQYIKNTSARFCCYECGRTWPSNRVMVLFHMQLRDGEGVVKVRRFRQNCRECFDGPMDEPSISPENIDILMESLMKQIRIKCYHEDLGPWDRTNQRFDTQSPHEPAHCEGCMQGICPWS